MESTAPAQAGRLHCQKFDCWADVEDAACTRPDDYCDVRERCGIYFLMTERNARKNERKKEGENASV